MIRHTEDGCVIKEYHVVWRDDSAYAYCRSVDAKCWGLLPLQGEGHKGALATANVHTLSTGHRCTVESTDHYIVDVTLIQDEPGGIT